MAIHGFGCGGGGWFAGGRGSGGVLVDCGREGVGAMMLNDSCDRRRNHMGATALAHGGARRG